MTQPPHVHPMKWAEIDTSTLRRNARAFREAVGGRVGLMAMVKADAYGHGVLESSRAFLDGGATWLGVALPGEALELRRGGVDAPILVVGWAHPETHAALIEAGVDLTLAEPRSLDAVVAAARQAGRPARVHLKVDTGMNRQGIRPEQVAATLDAIAAAGGQVTLAGIFTHFADADGPDPTFTEAQHRRFLTAVEQARAHHAEVLVHCCNSAAALRFPHMRHDLVRPGIALYGYLPPNTPAAVVQPAMTVRAVVTHVKTVPAGDAVGYGCTWVAPADTRIATVAAGYADGVHRAQSNRGSVLANGIRCPIVGTVSMDQITVDVSAAGGVEVGDAVIILGGPAGAGLGADEVAAVEGTIAYEVLCAVSARVPRRVVDQAGE
jgi:alanine racemase